MANDNTLKICLTGSTEKTIPNYGEAFVNGARLAISELSDPVKKKIELKVHYYDVTPLAALDELQKMRKSECDAIIGFSTGNDLLAIENDLAEKPILTMSIYGDPVERYESTNYLRTLQPSAKHLASHLFKSLPVKIKSHHRVLIVTASDRSEMLEYKKSIEPLILERTKDVTNVAVIEQTHDLSEFRKILSKNNRWDFLVLLTRSLVAARVTDEVLANSKMKKPIVLGTKYFGSSELPAYLNFLKNKNVEAYFSRQNCMCNNSKEFVTFVTKYLAMFKREPMLISVDTYDLVKFLSLSVGKISKINSRSIVDYFNSSKRVYFGVGTMNILPGLQIKNKREFLIKVSSTGYESIE
ncbi:MAG: hypothetical protein ACOVP4_13635 [Bacteriovoracaceae bacterium]